MAARGEIAEGRMKLGKGVVNDRGLVSSGVNAHSFERRRFVERLIGCETQGY